MRRMAEMSESQHLQRLEVFVAGYPEGVSIAALARELPGISRRTLNRRLATLVNERRVKRQGEKRGAIYLPIGVQQHASFRRLSPAEFETPEGAVQFELASLSQGILDYVSRPVSARRPVGYESRFLDDYQPNRTSYLSGSMRAHLQKMALRDFLWANMSSS